MKKYEPISKKYPHMLYGGDYNPEQWMDYQGIWDEDMRLMKLANCNTMTIGVFSWVTHEPEEDKYNFTFLDEIMDRFEKNGINAILATPSGAMPLWMSNKHPEVLRVNADRTKNLHGGIGGRHNHCFTSPYYREKTQKINRLLAQRYKNHQALIMWHISNEYGGECHCPLCQEAFRQWLKSKYNNSLDKLNHEYWAKFWSHTYTSWEQIESPSPIGDRYVHALNLDWKRFVTYQTIDFMKNELMPIKEITPDIPVTTNMMGLYEGLDYFKFKDVIDVVSWDNYPTWHSSNDISLASETAFVHDFNRSLKDGKPFMLMESCPSQTNWMPVSKLKRPNMNTLTSVQAVAHGSDTVQFFQWRKSRGSCEKLHGAVVDHCGHENTRVFKEISNLGSILSNLDDVVGTYAESQTAIIYDWENRWAIDDLKGLKSRSKKYPETCQKHYYPFWQNGVSVDVIDSDCDFSKYKLIIAPMLYMIKPNVIGKIKEFVENGGTIVCTYAFGWVNENDLCFLGGFPANELKEVFGIWCEETDSLYDNDSNWVTMENGREYKAKDYCEIIHANTAEVLATYKEDFYKDMPAITINKYGKGNAYFIAFRDEGDFLADFYENLIADLKLEKALNTKLPDGVTAHKRQDGNFSYIFIENYNNTEKKIILPNEGYSDMITKEQILGEITLEQHGVKILRNAKSVGE